LKFFFHHNIFQKEVLRFALFDKADKFKEQLAPRVFEVQLLTGEAETLTG